MGRAGTETRLRASVVDVDRRLIELLDEEAAAWTRVDRRLRRPVDLLRAFATGGGKRVRPAFVLAAYHAALGAPRREDDAVELAVAVELLHAFALIHDDVIDGSRLRRGRASVPAELYDQHERDGWRGDGRRYGDGMAVLVGDLALTLADRIVAGLAGGCDPVSVAVRDVWTAMRTELVMGEYLDVTCAAEGAACAFDALLIAHYKSGAYTVERPLHLGAALAGRLGELEEPLSSYGHPLGEAFQLRDDLLGVYGAESVTGKPVGEDLREGKATLLLGLGREMAGSAARPLLSRVGDPSLTPDDVAELAALLDRCGARAAVEEQIRLRHAAALDALRRAPLTPPGRYELQDLAGSSVWRAA